MATVRAGGAGGSILGHSPLVGQEDLTMATRTIDPLESAASSDAVRPVSATDVACRALDIVVAAIALVLLSPLFVIIAAVVRLESAGPSFFSQRRVGRLQKPYTVHKFRTMTAGASHDRHREFVQSLLAGDRPEAVDGQPRFKLAGDDRITRVGRFLRRSSLDGDMSLVGPRPPIHYEVDHYPAPHWFRRFEVKPGITGLWQVSGRCELTLAEMIDLDLAYVERRSLRLNVSILLRTLPAVLTSRGAS
jgi:lipopolysaccharide/colanic/teichoic acid biosynthesis glycosyltransferase